MAVLAGTDFFTAEVLTWRGLVTFYVLYFLHLETRCITLAGITRHPTETWMTQKARHAVDEPTGTVRQCRYLLHDRDAKFCIAFQDVFASEGIRCLKLPTRSPNLNAFAERWVRSVKEECLSKLILFGERSLHRAVTVRRLFPFGTQSSGQRERGTIPRPRYGYNSSARPLSRTPWWPPSILLPG